MSEVRAVAKYVRTSPYKMRRVVDLIRGAPVVEARRVLSLTDRGATGPIRKCLESAVGNAESSGAGLVAEELYVAKAFVDEGPTLKRWRPRARGRATRIRKRTSHVTICLSEILEES